MTALHLVSYNILAERWNKSAYDWQHRLCRIKEYIEKKRPDILCLQEVELANVEVDFAEFFTRLGYQWVSHRVGKKRNSPVGNLTAVLDTTVEITVEYKSAALITTFSLSQRKITVANVHLKAGLKSGLSTRISQLQSVVKALPVAKTIQMVVGDFNDPLLEQEDLHKILCAVGITNTHERRLTTYTPGEHNYWAFDWCYCNQGTVETLNGDLAETIPNEEQGSDHYPLEVIIIIPQ